MLGREAFRAAVREYLDTYQYASADWDDLAAIFDRHTPADIDMWSRQWIYSTGMPEIYLEQASEEIKRAAQYLHMHEAFLQGDMPAHEYFQNLMLQFGMEENPQILRLLVNNMRSVYWRFLNPAERATAVPRLEEMLWNVLLRLTPSEKPLAFEAFVAMVNSDEGLQKLIALYDGSLQVADFSLTEDQRFDIVVACMIREHPAAEALFTQLRAATKNADRVRRLDYLRPALLAEAGMRDAFFVMLQDPANRRPEPWVLEALQYLHHPLRNQYSRKYVAKSLEMLNEIQRTGDIFFPLGWLEANLSGYGDAEMAATVRDYLKNNPDLDKNLRNKVLQAADLLFRAGSL